MASGQHTLTHHGVFDVTPSGGTLKAAVDAIVSKTINHSGGGLHLIPVANGQQIAVLQVEVAP